MATWLVDTGVIIRYLRRWPSYRDLLDGLARQDVLWVASITRVEIIRGMREHERLATMAMLNALEAHPLDVPTADLAGHLIRTWQAQGRTMEVPDAVIGASALRLGAELITTNPKDFPFDGLRVHSFDAQGHLTAIR